MHRSGSWRNRVFLLALLLLVPLGLVACTGGERDAPVQGPALIMFYTDG